MGLDMRDNGRTTICMERGSSHTLMGILMLAVFMREVSRVSENFGLLLGTYILGYFGIICLMVKALKLLKIRIDTKGTLKTVKKREKAN
jgi:hypothetical protein